MMASTGGWYLGLGIGVSIVVVVVVLVCMIIGYAAKIAGQAKKGTEAMDAAFANTDSVWRIRDINRSTTGIWRAAESARKSLGG